MENIEYFPMCQYDGRYSGVLCSPELRLVRFEVGYTPIFFERIAFFTIHSGDKRKAPDCYTGFEKPVGRYALRSSNIK